jgi:hypothetical protein
LFRLEWPPINSIIELSIGSLQFFINHQQRKKIVLSVKQEHTECAIKKSLAKRLVHALQQKEQNVAHECTLAMTT